MAAKAKQREQLREIADELERIAQEITELLDSWDDADREERDDMTEQLTTLCSEAAGTGEACAKLYLALADI